MTDTLISLTLRLSPEEHRLIEEWRGRQKPKIPSMTQALRTLLLQALEASRA